MRKRGGTGVDLSRLGNIDDCRLPGRRSETQARRPSPFSRHGGRFCVAEVLAVALLVGQGAQHVLNIHRTADGDVHGHA